MIFIFKNQINPKLSQLDNSNKMLKRRASKRFVLAETGEESAWNTTTDNDPTTPVPPPQIEIGLATSSSVEEVYHEVFESPPVTPVAQLLSVPQLAKTGMK